MLDLRYHVASLSAVFLALVVGILVGVGISGRGFVDKSERRNFENQIAALQARADQLTAEKELLAQQGHAAESFVQDTYPVLMRNRLAGKRIAVIVIERSAPADVPTQRFIAGLLNGLRQGGVPVVGAEEVDALPSLVSSWQAVKGMSSVDDVDTPSGKLALVLLLGGSPTGSFGLKPTADAPLPRIEPAA